MSPNTVHTDPTKRHDFLLLFDVSHGNPNGDPDAEDLPRIDPETMHGLITDVCIKRKVRDYVANVLGKPIFIQSQVALNQLILKGFTDVGYKPAEIALSDAEREDDELMDWLSGKSEAGFSMNEDRLLFAGEKMDSRFVTRQLTDGLDEEQGELRTKLQSLAKRLAGAAKEAKKMDPETQQNAQVQLRADYFDIRMFGAVLSTGLNAGQVRGPMQLTFGRSLDPIVPLNLSITRQARTTSERMETGKTEIGRKPLVLYGLYVTKGFYNPFLNNGKEGSVTAQDMADFWESFGRMFEFDRSASRGEMTTQAVFIFTHEDPKGNAPSHRLFQLITDRVPPLSDRESKGGNGRFPRSIKDYEPLPTREEIQEAVDERYSGVSVTVLVG